MKSVGSGRTTGSVAASALEALVGEATDVFREQYWEKRPWLGRGQLPTLIDVAQIEDYVSLGRLGPQAIRLFQEGVPVEPGEYSMTTSRGQEVVRPERIVELFARGSTLVLESLHLRFPNVAVFCQSLAEDLGQPTQANAYYSPPQATGFALHHDTHDVFVVQLAGSKNWRVHEPVVYLPLPDQPYDRHTIARTPVVLEHRLTPGDVLYLPRGWVHQADTDAETSLHLTVGVLVYTWYEDVKAALRLASRDHLLLRRAAGTGSVSEVLQCISALLQSEVVRDRIDEQRVQSGNPPVPGRFREVLANDAIDMTTLLRRRQEIPVHMARRGATVELSLPEKTVRIPEHLELAARWIVSRAESFQPSDMPGDLSMAARLILIRRLVREGVLRLDTDPP